jgi:hypothetical protein
MSSPIGVTAARKPILQHSCLMLEEELIFRTFCARIETHLGTIDRPIHCRPAFMDSSAVGVVRLAAQKFYARFGRSQERTKSRKYSEGKGK